MAMQSPEITQMLVAWSNGDPSAFEKLAPIASQELQRLAKRYMTSLEETAEVLKVSVGTVRRDWTLARAWLHRELRGGRDDS